MKRLMKKFVLLTLLLQLCVSVQIVKGLTEAPPREPKLGDMLKFDRKLPCTDIPVYSHYAVFVGNTDIDGKKPGENIFEMTSEGFESGCRFSKLKETPTIYNYKDNTLPLKSDEEIKKIILKLKQECEPWRLTNTCEHVATGVRYGEINSQCNQENTLAGLACKYVNSFTTILKKNGRGRRSKYLRPGAAAA